MAVATDTEMGLDQHDDESASELSDLLETVEEKKEKIDDVKDFTHPCGGSGWVQVEYLDFRESGTSCPPAFAQTMYPERPHTCGIKSQTEEVCDLLTVSVGGRQYSKVCGRIRAYQFGAAGALGRQAMTGRTINEVYLSGISLTHGGMFSDLSDPPTHIWSFTAGLTQFQLSSFSLFDHCPCGLGPDPPDFVGEDYFCQSVIEEEVTVVNFPQVNTVFYPRNVLWDGEGCGDVAPESNIRIS